MKKLKLFGFSLFISFCIVSCDSGSVDSESIDSESVKISDVKVDGDKIFVYDNDPNRCVCKQ